MSKWLAALTLTLLLAAIVHLSGTTRLLAGSDRNAEWEAVRDRWRKAPADPTTSGPPRLASSVSSKEGWGRFAAFRDRFGSGPDAYKGSYVYMEASPVPLPAGRLVGSDAGITYGSHPYSRPLPTGRFRVAALIDRATYPNGEYDTAVAGAVFYSAQPVARWVVATWSDADHGRRSDKVVCYPVDSSKAALFDAGTFYRVDDHLKNASNREALLGPLKNTEAFFPIEGLGGGGAIYDPRSDGCYTTYFGLASDGSVAVAMTDFSGSFRAAP